MYTKYILFVGATVMQKKINVVEWIKRALFYVVGLAFVAFGINIAKVSDLGISPVSSIPFVLGEKFTFLSNGNWTTIIYAGFVLVQLILLLKQFKWYYLFQIGVALLFGFLVDGTALIVKLFLSTPDLYVWKLLLILWSIVLIAFGIFLYLEANIMSMPGEGVTVAISTRFKLSVPTAKLIFDISITAIAVILSFCFFGKLQIVREGTAFCMVGVGLVMKPIMKLLKKPLHTFIYGKEQTPSPEETNNAETEKTA